MSSWIGILALGALSLFIMLFPLWQRRADRGLGTGIESDDIAVQWELEKDRLVKEQHDLDIALAEGKITAETHMYEREQVVEDAKRALEKLRQARSMSEKLAASNEHKPRSYPTIALIMAGLTLVCTIGLILQLKGLDIHRQVKSANGKPQIQMADIEKMVASLEARVKAGEGSEKDEMMLARSYVVLGKRDQAIALYQKIHAQDAGNINVIMALGEIYFNSKNDSEQNKAQVYFDKALAVEPDKPEALWFKSLGLVRNRKLDEARVLLVRLQSVAKDNKKAQKAIGQLLAELDKNRNSSSGNNVKDEGGDKSPEESNRPSE